MKTNMEDDMEILLQAAPVLYVTVHYDSVVHNLPA